VTVLDLTLQVPPDAGFAPMVRDLALHGARTAGCAEATCAAFGREVEDAVRALLESAKGAMVPVAVRRDGGRVEVVIGSGAAARTITLEA
jgi:hypothetical protein